MFKIHVITGTENVCWSEMIQVIDRAPIEPVYPYMASDSIHPSHQLDYLIGWLVGLTERDEPVGFPTYSEQIMLAIRVAVVRGAIPHDAVELWVLDSEQVTKFYLGSDGRWTKPLPDGVFDASELMIEELLEGS